MNYVVPAVRVHEGVTYHDCPAERCAASFPYSCRLWLELAQHLVDCHFWLWPFSFSARAARTLSVLHVQYPDFAGTDLTDKALNLAKALSRELAEVHSSAAGVPLFPYVLVRDEARLSSFFCCCHCTYTGMTVEGLKTHVALNHVSVVFGPPGESSSADGARQE